MIKTTQDRVWEKISKLKKKKKKTRAKVKRVSPRSRLDTSAQNKTHEVLKVLDNKKEPATKRLSKAIKLLSEK